MSWSIRTKLTLWYLSIVGAALLVLGGVLYFFLSKTFLNLVDSSLQFHVRALAANATASPTIENEAEFAESPTVPASPESGALVLPPQLIQFVDETGNVSQQVLEQSEQTLLGKSPTKPLGNWREAGRLSSPYFETIELARGHRLRLATLAVRSEGQLELFITVGQELDGLIRLQNTVLQVVGVSIPIILVLLGSGGWLLVTQTLKPVDQLTRAAQRIGEGNLRELVQTPKTGDELARLAETFNQMITRLNVAFERQRQFTADASHEFRTPLAIMRSELELALQRERPAEDYQQTLESLLEETRRLNKLVDDLLTLARSDSGELALESNPVDLGALCTEVTEAFMPLAELREQQLRRTLPEGKAMVSGDQQWLRRLLLNLLDNALKYTPSGGQIELEVEVIPGDASHQSQIRVLICDTGPGIPQADRERIFDRFYRHCHTGSNEQGGFGLGLSICRWIVQAHHGTLKLLDSERGAVFEVVLPGMKNEE
ncbi:MAG TPA: ATP-binding protein [Acidobacteriota bacterium]|nr:ATP-binding protein [Acidobacteriota bacterium]